MAVSIEVQLTDLSVEDVLVRHKLWSMNACP